MTNHGTICFQKCLNGRSGEEEIQDETQEEATKRMLQHAWMNHFFSIKADSNNYGTRNNIMGIEGIQYNSILLSTCCI